MGIHYNDRNRGTIFFTLAYIDIHFATYFNLSHFLNIPSNIASCLHTIFYGIFDMICVGALYITGVKTHKMRSTCWQFLLFIIKYESYLSRHHCEIVDSHFLLFPMRNDPRTGYIYHWSMEYLILSF